MRFAFIVDPPESLKAHKDSSVAMMREASRRGHEVHVLEASDLIMAGTRVLGRAQEIRLLDDHHDWYEGGETETQPLEYFDAVLMRKDPPVDGDYLAATHMLEMAERQGARVFNRPRALRDFNEKLAVLHFPRFAPESLVASSAIALKAFLAEQGEAILKPLHAMGGESVFRVRADEPNLNVILETLTLHERRPIMAQRYLPEIGAGDKRILVVGGKPAPHCLARIPREGDTRGNLAAGATGIARPLTERDQEIARAVGVALMENGVLLAGLDVIGGCLTEINITSPTCMVEISAQTGFSVAAMMLDALEAACAG